MGNGIEVVLSSSNTSLSFTFTAEGDYQSQTVTLTSAGTDDLTITGISSPAAPYGVDFTDCGTIPITLNSGSSCELIISYTTETSASNSSILITSDDPNSPLEIVLSGSGLTDPVFVPVLDSFGLWILLLLTLLTANFYLILTRR
jgi:hypothetical protein